MENKNMIKKIQKYSKIDIVRFVSFIPPKNAAIVILFLEMEGPVVVANKIS